MLLAALLACQPPFEERLASARELHDSGQLAEATEALANLVLERPDAAEAHYLLGSARLASGEPTLAAWSLSRAAQSPEFATEAGTLLAGALLATSNADAALQAAERVLAAEPQDAAALELRGLARLQTHDPEAALLDAEAALALEPGRRGALGLRVMALAALERLDEAEIALAELRRIASESGAEQDARLCLAGARLAQAKGELERATRALEVCLDAFPGDAPLVQVAVGLYDEQDRPEEATAILRRALDAQPDALGARVLLAERLREAGEAAEARALLEAATRDSTSALPHRALAGHLRRSGELEAARAAMEQALARDAGDDESLRFEYADLLIDLDELAAAEEQGRDLASSIYADLIVGRLRLARGDAEGALEALTAAIQLWPNNPGARYLAGRAAAASGDLDRALSELREALRTNEEATDAAFIMSQIYRARGEHLVAYQFGMRFAASHPEDPRGYLAAARSASKAGRPELARQVLSRLAEREEYAALAVAERAEVERRAEGPEAALRAIDESGLDLAAPGSEPALRAWIEFSLEAGRGQQAFDRLDALLATRPDAAHLHSVRGRLLARTGAGSGPASEAFERALELDPGHADALEGLGRLTAQEGRLEEAVDLFDRAAAAEPDRIEHAYAAAQLLVAAGRPAEAESRLDELVVKDPIHVGTCNDLAWLLAERGQRLDRALDLARLAVSLEPSANTYDTLGFVHLRRREPDQAARSLQQSLALNPAAAGARYRLGLALEALGDIEGARGAFEQALESESFPEMQNAREQLRRLSAARGR